MLDYTYYIGSDGSYASDCDIGQLLQRHQTLKNIDRETMYQIITSEPNPDPSSYPRSRPSASSSFRQFQPNWLKQYPWLHYSRSVDGAFCRACAFFAPESVGGHVLGQLVTKPLKVWNKMSEKASAHNKYDYHLASLARMSEFRARYENPTQSIDTILNRECQLQMERNAPFCKWFFYVVSKGHRDDHINLHEADDTLKTMEISLS